MQAIQPTTDPQNEVFPIVNEQDEVIGKISRQEAHRSPHLMHRAVGVFILNSAGEILLQKRSATKDTFPNAWEILAGHVQYGQKYLDTAVRELEEELGIIASPNDLLLTGKIIVTAPGLKEIWQVYRYQIADEISPVANALEVSEIKFVKPAELRSMLSDSAVKWSETVRQAITGVFFVETPAGKFHALPVKP
ncbi:MAG: NUDIX domain-containing protein [bacterium]|nr:NUDIX domain-containing protein [bacterium]